MSLQNKPTREIPNWVSGLILLLVLLGGGWGLWHYAEGDAGELPASAQITLTDANVDGPGLPRTGRMRPPNLGAMAARIAANMPDGIVPTGNGYLVKSGTARLDIDLPNGKNNHGDWRYRFSYALGNLLPQDQMDILRVGRRAVNDPAAAKIGVTQQQVQQLRSLPGGGMVVEAADRARIDALFHEWLAASGRSATSVGSLGSGATNVIAIKSPPATRPATVPPVSPEALAAQKKLVAALADIAKQQLEPTKKAYAARVQQTLSILGDGLVQKLKQTG